MFKQNSPILSLVVTVAIPSLILSKLSGHDSLGPLYALFLALSFPLVWSVYEWKTSNKPSLFSLLGITSTLLTGGFGLMQLDGIWFAVKEASIPAVLGVFTLLSIKTGAPFVRSMLFQESILNVEVVEKALKEKDHLKSFESLLVRTTYLVAVSFLLSSILNFALAVYLLKSPSGTPEFNSELAKMTALSYPVIALPCTAVTMYALWYLIKGIRNLTGLETSAIFKS